MVQVVQFVQMVQGAELAQAVHVVKGKVVEKCPKIARAMPETGAAVCPFRGPFNLSAIQTHPMISKWVLLEFDSYHLLILAIKIPNIFNEN